MKGIYCIKDEKKTYVIDFADDLDERKNEFESGKISNNDRVNRFIQRKKDLSFVVLKVTDNPEYEIWDYILPQIPRIRYEDTIKEMLEQKICKRKHVENAVNYFCTMFPSRDYSAIVGKDKDNYIAVYVVKEGIVTEIYGFANKKEPIYRSIRL